MKLTPAERETIILFDDAGSTANVYTHDHKLIEKLKHLHEKYPEQIFPDKKLMPVRSAIPYQNDASVSAPLTARSDEKLTANGQRKQGLSLPVEKPENPKAYTSAWVIATPMRRYLFLRL